ncbi:FixH family protein [Hyphomonas sp. CY54-11-8]|uniref:FixH family protein n=1 Tax=Hyphomonas sp. CY54-11-8 TaxID=1280944 RepID=UPI000458D39E|nr:FixH family protein [Hyphomonas sp. CY54-11-8]KCZ48778.1 hypothetical protein HY17_15530 [Hyphomonas sp. CY54-11-8]
MPVTATPKPFRLTGWHVFMLLCAFFGFMFIVNGIFLWAALSSFPGEDEQKSYLQGLHYNEAISARRIQEEQGWSAQIGLTPTETGDRLVVRFLDIDGSPLPAQDIEAQLRRTVTGAEDVPIDLQRGMDGDYFADISLLDKGVWEARVQAIVPYGTDEVEFVASKKLIIP